MRLMEPARGESYTSGQRQRPAAPGEDKVLSPDDNSLHTSTTPTTWGRKQRSARSIPPRRVWKPQPHWLVADWLRLMEPARGESCPSGQRRGPATLGMDGVSSSDYESFHISTNPTTQGRKRRSLGSMSPPKVWKPKPNQLVADWLRLMEPARGESWLSGQSGGPAAPGKDRILSPDQKSLHIATTNSNKRGLKTGIHRVETAPHGVETPAPMAGRRSLIGWGSYIEPAHPGEDRFPSPD